MTRPSSERLTRSERAELLERQGGLCIECGRTEKEAGKFHGEHTVPNALVKGKPDALMCSTCHTPKTAKDMGRIAKAKAQGGETGQYKRRKKRGFSLIQGRNDLAKSAREWAKKAQALYRKRLTEKETT